MCSSIDPRDVLMHLNELGYKNITAEQLKEFITDLKKLMKYEAKENEEKRIEENCASCRQKSGQGQNKTLPKRNNKPPINDTTEAKESIQRNKRAQSALRTCSRMSLVEKEEPKSKMWIRPPKPHQTFKSDPVTLYTNYQKEWTKFRNSIPGENKHLDLRWSIRERMLSGRRS